MMQAITVDDILTSSGRYPMRPKNWPPSLDVLANAREMTVRANALLLAFGESRKVRSGYRPRLVNENTPNAALNSLHITCRAIDLEDTGQELCGFVVDPQNLDVLEEIGLWVESPKFTPSWCHIQFIPPPSGRRIFVPR